MPKPIARRKTKKAAAKRFKVSAKGKVLYFGSGRRHLASSKNRKRMRRIGSPKVVDNSDRKRIVESLPFS
ncbi:50S ribosomal protein L35 [Methylacidiphilum caldifontis]|uniref:Large ribosomal subunit protein bL35 n=1 Tax=Methylacidiphilum caldifontis TaxID=2795386 RepID=A0A4Y8PG65_9BACT|nr:50S ribosomal protein L35 [Methylacidiphilum caldifontis]QSR89570.1 50S ribosomal protein L35 [Methylacidiphilum caldifontis]TFE71136.1 50S ribosomal protein L35 [Methylacidiphilum caldifontis]